MDTDIDRRARRIVHADLDLEGLCNAFDGLLRDQLPYAVAAWSTHDPATGLFTSCTISGMPKDAQREAALFRHEFRDGEPASFRSLIAEGDTVAILSEVTAGELEQASRYRNLLRDFGVTDELRAVLWYDGSAWGSATIYRLDGRFSVEDATRVAAVAPHVADGMRLVMLRTAATRPEMVEDPPGVLEVHADGRVLPLTGPAERWLELGGAALVTAVNATAAAVRERVEWPGAGSRLPLADGRVLSLHAASTTSGDGTVAVIVDLARPAEVGALLVDAYGLTPRQRQVLKLLLLGRSMTQIAGELQISEHTAHDHRKAIYQRTGVSSRSELAGLLQAEQYDPRVHQGLPPSPYGGFLEG